MLSLARFEDFIRSLSGHSVDVMVRGVSEGTVDGSAAAALSGVMMAGQDFIVLRSSEEGVPVAVKIADIILIQLTPDEECGCELGEDEEADTKMDIEKKFEDFWNEMRRNNGAGE